MDLATSDKPAQRKRGRPKRLDVAQILDAAVELGLERLEMTTLAERLGVGVGTIYGYVSSRAELMRMAAARQARQPEVQDVGQTWQDAIRAMARQTYEVFVENRQIVIEMAQGTYGSEHRNAHREAMVRLLTSRGFSRSDAVMLYHEINSAVIGAAVAHTFGEAYPGWQPDLVVESGYPLIVDHVIAFHETRGGHGPAMG